jgi:hypothetical protein
MLFEEVRTVMNRKIVYIMAFFSIFLIVSLTPAFAVKMGDVADDAKNYEIESHKKKGFFGKIHFLVKGFKLVKTAENAQKGSNPQDGNDKVDNYESVLNGTLNSFCQAHNLLIFKNSKAKTIEILKTQKTNTDRNIKKINGIKNFTNTTNNIKNSTNTMNNTNNTVNNSTPNFEIPDYCHVDVKIIMDRLAEQGIKTSITIQPEISKALEGKIVQIIDNEGYLRYVMVENITDSQVTILKNNNNTKNMSIGEFKAAYTGIILESSSGTEVLAKIVEIQEILLQKQKNTANQLKDDIKSKLIIWSILAGVSILLIIIGALIGIFFAKAISNNVTAQATANVEVTCEQTCNALSTESAHAGGHLPVFANFEGSLYTVTATEGYVAGNVGGVSAAAAAALGMGASIASLVTVGLIVVPIIGIELVSNIMLQNWIKVIFGSVGLI